MFHHQQSIAINDLLPSVVLVGNPNVGKSVIFRHLTGKYVTVSNYPGTTVEISDGIGKFGGEKYRIIDTPGINSLIPESEDERVTRNILLSRPDIYIVQVGDSKNLQRTLILTFQLLELGLPLVLVLNMADEAKERGIQINVAAISTKLQIPVVETVAITAEGINDLKSTISNLKYNQSTQPIRGNSKFTVNYGEKIESALKKIQLLLPPTVQNKRGIAIMLLSGDDTILENNPSIICLTEAQQVELQTIIHEMQESFTRPLSIIITEKQSSVAEELVNQVAKFVKLKRTAIREALNRLTLHPFWGTGIGIMILYLMYQFVGKLAAGVGVDFLHNTVFNKYLNPFISQVVYHNIPSSFIQRLLVGEYGLVTMALTYAFAIIFPIVTAFFIFFGFLEDSGYLPRLAVMSQRILRRIGLHGKAVLPLVLGLGCGTMAVLTTRILDTKKERLLAIILLGLAIPCSAQLGVILAMLSALSWQAMLVWLSSILVSLLIVGAVAEKFIPGKRSNFLIELPPLRLPQFKNIFLKTGTRILWYIKEAVPLFILGTLILFFLDTIQVLRWFEQLTSPIVVGFLELPKKVTQIFFIGFLRRDYGAAGLLIMAQQGLLSNRQIVVSAVAITLFIPCIAQVFVTIKEQGIKWGMIIFCSVILYAIIFSGLLNSILKSIGF
ncbi:MAG: ferrous iron transport protein B [bacterium]|nr:ferrous iron transport protein B [bacterium]